MRKDYFDSCLESTSWVGSVVLESDLGEAKGCLHTPLGTRK